MKRIHSLSHWLAGRGGAGYRTNLRPAAVVAAAVSAAAVVARGGGGGWRLAAAAGGGGGAAGGGKFAAGTRRRCRARVAATVLSSGHLAAGNRRQTANAQAATVARTSAICRHLARDRAAAATSIVPAEVDTGNIGNLAKSRPAAGDLRPGGGGTLSRSISTIPNRGRPRNRATWPARRVGRWCARWRRGRANSCTNIQRHFPARPGTGDPANIAAAE